MQDRHGGYEEGYSGEEDAANDGGPRRGDTVGVEDGPGGDRSRGGIDRFEARGPRLENNHRQRQLVHTCRGRVQIEGFEQLVELSERCPFHSLIYLFEPRHASQFC